MKQKTFLSVKEVGTEGVAATIIGMDIASDINPAPSPSFHVTRPFIYAIREISTGATLFMGVTTSIQ